MKIKFLGALQEYKDIEFNFNDLKGALSAIRFVYGLSLIKYINDNSFLFFLEDSLGYNKPTILRKETLTSTFDGYDCLSLVPVVEGSTGIIEGIVAAVSYAGSAVGISSGAGAAGGAAAAAGAGAAAGTGAVYGVAFAGVTIFEGLSYGGALLMAAVGNIAISAAVSGIMQLLSPTPEFSNDPGRGKALKSNLFGNAPITLEEGGVMPLVMGNPYCSGILISSALYTTPVAANPLLFFGS